MLHINRFSIKSTYVSMVTLSPWLLGNGSVCVSYWLTSAGMFSGQPKLCLESLALILFYINGKKKVDKELKV